MTRVEVRPEMLRWARERAGLDQAALLPRFPRLEQWETGQVADLTLKQLEGFARATHAPVGFLFLDEPPVEPVPIPDFRTIGNTPLGRPSPDLLDMVYVCQQRQEWYRDYARTTGEPPVPFVGSLLVGSDVTEAAARIRDALSFDVDERAGLATWTDALRRFMEQADQAGVLVMTSGVVLNNNRRRLNPQEFRGFALADPYAPLVFINGADTKAAQIFTLAHELAHIWAGITALSDADARAAPAHDAERWCNQVAAEVLVPMQALRAALPSGVSLPMLLPVLARRFKVSTLVILRRLYDAAVLDWPAHDAAYREELARLMAMPRGRGGDFYLTQAARVGKRFARSLVVSTLEGQTLHRDAFRLLGFSKLETFYQLGRSLGVAV